MLRPPPFFSAVGEPLTDEPREYGPGADWLGAPRHTFSAMFGAVIARGEDYRQVFQHFKPGFDLATGSQIRLRAGLRAFFNPPSPYPEVRPCMEQLKADDYMIGVEELPQPGSQTHLALRRQVE